MPDRSSYLFWYGSFPKVSIAELESLKECFCAKASHTYNYQKTKSSFISNTTSDQVLKIFNRSGSFPKVSQVVATIPIDKDNQVESLSKILLNHINQQNPPQRLYLGINIHNLRFRRALPIKKELKKELNQHGLKVNLPGNMLDLNLSPVTILKRILNKNGFDFDLIWTKKEIIISQTLSVQSPEYWRNLDINKPEKDLKIGMLPPKLARIMLNLARLKPENSIWDPFCGLGNLIIQSQLLDLYGFGTDINPKTVSRAQNNLTWLVKQGLVKQPKYSIFTFDIQKDPYQHRILKDIGKNEKFDAIVTEPYMGPGLRRKDSYNPPKITQIWQEIKPLYQLFIKNSYKMIKPGGYLVFIKPKYLIKVAKGTQKWYNPKLKINHNLWLEKPGIYKDLYWEKPDSILVRQIMILQKKFNNQNPTINK